VRLDLTKHNRNYCITLRRTMGLGHPNLYEALTEGLPTKLYADIDLWTASKVEGDFERYKRHLDEVRDAFLVDVLGIPNESIRFECSEAHGDAADGGYKWSVHELLRGYYLEDFHARNEFKKAFEHFQKHLPAHLQHCDEYLWHTPNPQRGPKLIWDPSVFAKFKCFRMLYSRKRGSDRPLLPVEGSSPQLPTAGWHLRGGGARVSREDRRWSAAAVQPGGRGGYGGAPRGPPPSYDPGRRGGGASRGRHSGRRGWRASDRA
jgi:hypothetical protein